MQCIFEEKSKYWHPHLHCLSICCYAMNVSNTYKAQRERHFFCVTRSIKIKDKHFIESYNIFFLFYIIAATKQDLEASEKNNWEERSPVRSIFNFVFEISQLKFKCACVFRKSRKRNSSEICAMDVWGGGGMTRIKIVTCITLLVKLIAGSLSAWL